jgi:hypothetical protein
MKNLNRTAKLAFFNARRREGDVSRIISETGMSPNHTRRMLAAERRINEETADTAYEISYMRRKNSEIGYSL